MRLFTAGRHRHLAGDLPHRQVGTLPKPHQRVNKALLTVNQERIGLTRPCSMTRHEDPIPLRQRNPALPAELEAVVMRALRRQGDQRWPDVAAFRAALAPFE